MKAQKRKQRLSRAGRRRGFERISSRRRREARSRGGGR
jgi:hypothetical protein